jgi:hypothetical protein
MRDLGDFDPVAGEPIAGEAEDQRMVAIGLQTRF